MIQDMVGSLYDITGMPCAWGGMKCIFSGTSIEMPGNDALRLAMISDVPCSVDRLQMVICVPIVQGRIQDLGAGGGGGGGG